jgi:hypothetical protein
MFSFNKTCKTSNAQETSKKSQQFPSQKQRIASKSTSFVSQAMNFPHSPPFFPSAASACH